MSSQKNWSYTGRGINYIRKRGETGGFRPMGNCSSLVFAAAVEKQTQRNYMTASGGNIASEESISGMTAQITMLNLSPENIAIGFRGRVFDQKADTVVDEVHTAYTGTLVPFDFQPDTSKAVTVTAEAGGDPYTADEDYQVTRAGILILEGGAIDDGSEIKVGYTKSLAAVVQALVDAGAEYELIFDGLNAADSGKAATVRAYILKFSPTQNWGLISDDYGELQVEAEVLPDLTKTGAGISQYFQATLQQ